MLRKKSLPLIFGQFAVFCLIVFAAVMLKSSSAAAAPQKASNCNQGTNSTWGVTLNVGVRLVDKNGNVRGMAQNFRFNVAVFTPWYSNYGGGYGQPPPPPGILENIGGINADNPRWSNRDFTASASNTLDCGFGTHFFKFDEQSGSDQFALDCYFNPGYPGFNGDGFTITGLGVDDPGWQQGYFTYGRESISSGDPLQDLNLQDFMIILEWHENADGIIQTAKYFPEDSLPNNFNVPSDIATTPVRLYNKNHLSIYEPITSSFASSAANPYNQPGIWVSDNNYRVEVEVPTGYRINRTNRGAPSCTGPDNTGRCSVIITVRGNGNTEFVDFWFETLIQPVCGNITSNPANTEPGQQFSVDINAGATGPAKAGGMAFSITANIPGVYSGTLNGVIPQGSTSGTVTAGPFTRPIGTYNGSYTIRFANGYTAGPCTGAISIAARPFFIANNGDISSGFSSGSTTCTATASSWAASNGKLVSWFDIPTSKGAGTMLATLALTQIDGVRSAKLPTSPPINQLSFGNVAAGSYGGLYGGTIGCPKDYYSRHTGVVVGSSTGVLTTDAQGTGSVTLTGGTLGSGTRSALYVDGNVYITNNVILNNTGVTGPKQLANFYLVVRGNIYIAPGVTRLDGVYIAQGSAGKGQIYTCAQAFAPPTTAMLSNNGAGGCGQNILTVNGAFIADKLNLYRSSGTLYQDTPAEIFNYTPATWLAPPASISPLFTGDNGTPSSGDYEAITTLQPVL